jgi:hypothetical protein
LAVDAVANAPVVRRIRKTTCPVVWEAVGPHPVIIGFL